MELRYTANRYYFAYQKPSTFLHRIGYTFAAITLVLIVVYAAAAIILGILSVCFLLVSEELNESDTDIDEQVRRETNRLCKEFEDKHWDTLNPYPRMIISSIGDFVTEGEGLKTRRAKAHGKTFTSRYEVVAIGLKNQRLYYSGEKYSLIDENEFSATEGEYDFLELDRADYAPVEGATIPHCEFALIKRDGEEAFRVPAPDDDTTERYTEDLNTVLEHAREKAQESAQQ